MTELLSKARAARATRSAALGWEGMEDPRKARGKRHPHPGMLNLLVSALASGARTLRQVEELSEDLPGRARKRMGLNASVSDTALDELARRQKPMAFPKVLERQVKQGLKDKRIQHDAFPFGVVAIDGKAVWVGNHAAHRLCQRHTRDDGSPYWMLFAQRAVLVSSSAKPCVGQHFIANKEAETSEFGGFFASLVRNFGKSFEMVTSDAGCCSRKNARLIHQANKGYLLALKDNQPNLLAEAKSRLSSKDMPGDEQEVPELALTERYQGMELTRCLFRVQVAEGDTLVDLPGARQLWRVRQTRTWKDGRGQSKRVVEDRYFATNRVLSAANALRLVRLHWGIENNAFWTLDVAMGEDHSTPCQRGEGLVVLSWLRLLAYNVAAIFRSKQPTRHGDKLSWWRAFELLRRAFTAEWLPPEDSERATATLV